MALTVLLALAGAADPLDDLRAGRRRAARDRPRRGEGEPAHARRARGSTRRCSSAALRIAAGRGRPCAALLVVVSGVAASRMGSEFIPQPRRGRHRHARAAHSRHQPDASRSQMQDGAGEARCWSSPRSSEVVRQDRHGRGRDRSDAAERRRRLHHAEAARRVAGPAQAQGRPGGRDREARSPTVPGNNYEFTQPIQMRFNELISGVRSDVGGQGLRRRSRHAAVGRGEGAVGACRRVPGAADVKIEQVERPADADRSKPNRAALARYGLNVADVQEVVEIAVGGKEAGQVFEGDRRFDIVVRLPEHLRVDIDALGVAADPCCPCRPARALSCRRASARRAAATCRCRPWPRSRSAPGPNQISRENGKRRVVVTANVRGRDLGSFVAEVQREVAAQGEAAGRLLDRLGRPVRAARRGAQRLAIVVPVALLLIFVLLCLSLGRSAMRPWCSAACRWR